MKHHEHYMARCLQLAKNGMGTTYPNPLVGSIIVHDAKIIGEGWHYKAGEPHAEVAAIASVQDQSLLKKATIYVSLEPCSHYGKTPPCSDLIIAKAIPTVVIGTVDPFAKVAGTGIQKLIQAGCDVTVGVLEDECLALNKRFFTFHTKKRPYIILKWAASSDGYIAPKQRNDRAPVWITNTYSRQLVHKWRAEEQSILVGSTTVLQDNPKLTLRDWDGNHPTRIIINKKASLPNDSAVLNQSVPTIVITAHTDQRQDQHHLIFEKVNATAPTDIVDQICSILHQHDIHSVLIEGGAQTLQAFIDADRWDEARVFTGATALHEGIPAPTLDAKSTTTQQLLKDMLNLYYK